MTKTPKRSKSTRSHTPAETLIHRLENRTARLGVIGLKGDGAKARDYYARALAAGATGARERLAALAAK